MNKKYNGYKYFDLPNNVRRNMDERASEEIEKSGEEQRRFNYSNEILARALRRTYGESIEPLIEE